jgi:hypothetical protein
VSEELRSCNHLTFLNSEAHFRIVVEMGGGSVACGASTTTAKVISVPKQTEGENGDLLSRGASTAQQNKENYQSAHTILVLMSEETAVIPCMLDPAEEEVRSCVSKQRNGSKRTNQRVRCGSARGFVYL